MRKQVRDMKRARKDAEGEVGPLSLSQYSLSLFSLSLSRTLLLSLTLSLSLSLTLSLTLSFYPSLSECEVAPLFFFLYLFRYKS